MFEDHLVDVIAKATQPPVGPEDSAFHTGVINTWNSLTGVNTVTVNGVILANLKALHSGIGIKFNAGDVVIVMRKGTQYFVMGKVSAPGGSAGSSIQENSRAFVTTFGTAGAWADHPAGAPQLLNVTAYIGSSRSCIVFYRANIKVRVGDTGFGADIYDPLCLAAVSFAVSGATTIAPDTFVGQASLFQMENFNAGAGRMVAGLVTISGFMCMTSNHGLNQGTNTFTMKYKTGQTAEFQVPYLVVVPL